MVTVCQAAEPDRYKMTVWKDSLRRGGSYFTMRAIETADLAKPAPTIATMAPTLNYVASVGANTVCFNLHGLAGNGDSLAPECVQALRMVVGQTTWRRMGLICRVFGPDAPRHFAWRLKAARAAGAALKDDVRVVYWIEGERCAELVEAFKETAPDLVVAATEGGDVRVVREVPKTALDVPALLVGAMPESPKTSSIHFVLPDARESYEAIDHAMAHPVELEPWTPDNSVLSVEERDAGWVALFDGKTLDGWWIAGMNQKGFAAEEGQIRWKGGGGSAIMTRNRYGNFILRLEWKLETTGANSGIFLRAPRDNRQSKIGMEFQLYGDSGKPPHKNGTGAIYDVVAPLENASKPEGEWNELEITLDGPTMKAVLNGVVIQDRNFDDTEELKYRLRTGFIGLQDHGHPASWRNIRIKEL